MKILHINCNYMTTSLHQNMIELLDKKTDNFVYCPIIKGGKTSVFPRNNVVSDECFTTIDRVFYFIKQAKIYKSIKKNYDISQFNIIHAYTLLTDGNCAMKLSNKYNIPFVVAVRDTDINDFFKYKPYLINRAVKIMEKASKIFFLSETYKEKMINDYIPKRKMKGILPKMVVIPNGIDNFWLNNIFYDKEQLINHHNPTRIIFAGKIIKRKNIPIIQKAIEILNNRGVNSSLTVIGAPVDKAVFKHIISDKNTNYYPAMPKEELINQYRNNDIFCMASLHETFGLVYAEAMSQGLPVLYTKGQGFDGQFAEGIVGYHIDCHDAYDIANKIERIISNYNSIVSNCINLCNKFNWEIITSKYVDIYKEILDT